MKICFNCDKTEVPDEIDLCPDCGEELFKVSKLSEITHYTVKEIKELFSENKRFFAILAICSVVHILLTLIGNTLSSGYIIWEPGKFYSVMPRYPFPIINISNFISIILAFIIFFHFVHNDRAEKNYLTKKSFLLISFIAFIITLIFCFIENPYNILEMYKSNIKRGPLLVLLGGLILIIFSNMFVIMCFVTFIYIIFYKLKNGKIYSFFKKHNFIFICTMKISIYLVSALITHININFNFEHFINDFHYYFKEILNPMTSAIIHFLFQETVYINDYKYYDFLLGLEIIITIILDILLTILFVVIVKKLALRKKPQITNRGDAQIL